MRTTAVAGIHGCIGLDVRDPLSLPHCIGAVHRTDDSCRHRVVQSKGVANGNRPLSRLEVVGIAQWRHGEFVGHNAHHRNIRQRISAENPPTETAAIGKGDRHLISTFYHVGVGEDQSV